LISRFDASSSAINVSPDIIESSLQLDNTGLQIILKNASGTEIDRADDDSGTPFAGSNVTPKKSMERISPPGDGTQSANWQTAITHTNMDGSTTSDEFGTPKAENGT
jgi:hypothetical protein